MQLQIKPRKIWGFNGIWTHNPCDTGGAMLYQLSYEASSKQVKHEFNLYPLYEESEMMCIRYKSYFSDFFSGISLQLLKLIHNCEDSFQ